MLELLLLPTRAHRGGTTTRRSRCNPLRCALHDHCWPLVASYAIAIRVVGDAKVAVRPKVTPWPNVVLDCSKVYKRNVATRPNPNTYNTY